MPDLSLLLPPLSQDLLPVGGGDPSSSSNSRPKTLEEGDSNGLYCRWNHRLRFPISTRGTCSVIKRSKKSSSGGKALSDHVRVWVEKKIADGVDPRECDLPFLSNAPKVAECRVCSRCIHPGEEVLCSVLRCRQAYHRNCAQPKGPKKAKFSLKHFKCPQHTCFICKKRPHWRCVRCTVASCYECEPWPDKVIDLPNRQAICWRHPINWQLHDWQLHMKHADPTSDIEEAFSRLPLPYIDEGFKIGSILQEVMENKTEPSPYIHIRRNIYLVKRKRDGAEAGVGCTNCSADSSCRDDCECRGLSVSCSKACHCSDMCTNRPFRKDKKVKVVKTKFCGWGVVALEAMEKGDFVIEYIGEVIDDALCEQRLWDMKHRGDQNFYMCEIRKDFTIDATFKGNAARFLNHSCDPNCKLEKWQVDGETRVGVFASRSIEPGEPLTYDYRFEHFGPMVKCFCGSPQCQGFLGSKRRNNQFDLLPCWGCKGKINQFDPLPCWGYKRKRTDTATVSTVRLLT